MFSIYIGKNNFAEIWVSVRMKLHMIIIGKECGN